MSQPQRPHYQLATTASAQIAAAKRIDEIAAGAMELFKEAGSFAAELAVAQAMADMRAALTPEVMQPIMALMNTDLGFRTDRDPKVTPKDKEGNPMTPYSVDVVRECFIESKLRGFHTVGNEWNIIAARFYACKNGLRRKVTTWQGVTDFKDTYEVPRIVGDKGAIVKCRASWKKDGIADSIECEIPVRVNAYMGADAVLGKAERKLVKRVHDRLSGIITPEGEVGDDDLAAAKPATPTPNFSTPAETSAGANDAAKSEPPTGRPADAPASRPKPTLVEEPLTPQEQLEKIVLGAGCNFDDFISWGVRIGQITSEQSGNIISFADVPTELAKRYVNAKAGLLRGLKGASK